MRNTPDYVPLNPLDELFLKPNLDISNYLFII